MATAITRTTDTDDDGTGTTGTIHNNAWLQAIYNAIDAARQTITTISPTQITADQNNYNPTGLSTAQMMRLTTDASRTITGIVAQSGRRLIVVNAGAQNIVLAHASGSSTAANRITCPGGSNLTLGAGDSVELVYDGSAALWLVLAYT